MIRKRQKLMADKLYEQMSRGFIDNDWVEGFVDDIQTKLNVGAELTPKQAEKLEELFERY